MVFQRMKEPRTGKLPLRIFLRKGGAWLKVVGWAICWHTQGYTSLRAIQVPFAPLAPEWVPCVSLCLDLSSKPSAEAKGKAWVDIHDWPLRTPSSPILTRLVLKGPPTRLLESTLCCLSGSWKNESCTPTVLGKADSWLELFMILSSSEELGHLLGAGYLNGRSDRKLYSGRKGHHCGIHPYWCEWTSGSCCFFFNWTLLYTSRI